MKRKTIFIILLFAGIYFQSSGQTFKKQYNNLASTKDTAAQYKLLQKWEATDNNDPELYVSFFNYYVNKSMTEVIAIDKNLGAQGGIELKDSNSNSAGYLTSQTFYNSEYLNLGFAYIDKGISKFPTRLDMRFGKIYMLGKNEDYEKFTVEIINTVDYSFLIKNKWTWMDNKPMKDPKEQMLSSMQDYIVQLYNTNDTLLLPNMKRISESILKYYPDHVESLSNLSVVYFFDKQYDKALEVLLKAEKLAPTDYIVLANIAHAYVLKGDNKKAIKYYEKTVKYGSKEAKEFAKGKIEELKKN